MTSIVSRFSLGETIKIYRSREGISQAEMAKIVGVHPSTLRRWENDYLADKMTIMQFKKIAKSIHLPIPRVFNSKGKVLRKLRFDMNMSPAELAVCMQVSTSTIVRWERQESFDQLTLRQFKKIAQAAKIKLPDFLMDEELEINRVA